MLSDCLSWRQDLLLHSAVRFVRSWIGPHITGVESDGCGPHQTVHQFDCRAFGSTHLPTCTPPHTQAHAALASRHCPHHHTCIPIYIYLQIQFHTQLLPATRTHKDTQLSVSPSHDYSDTTHSSTARAPTYLAAWMSRPLAYISIPQTFAPSHRARVII